jgi:hypothetical protein
MGTWWPWGRVKKNQQTDFPSPSLCCPSQKEVECGTHERRRGEGKSEQGVEARVGGAELGRSQVRKGAPVEHGSTFRIHHLLPLSPCKPWASHHLSPTCLPAIPAQPAGPQGWCTSLPSSPDDFGTPGDRTLPTKPLAWLARASFRSSIATSQEPIPGSSFLFSFLAAAYLPHLSE